MEAIKEIVDHARSFADKSEDIKHGVPVRFTEASTQNDRIWQGDLAITIKDSVPSGYEPISIEDFNKINGNQLVHGSNIGSRHCIDDFNGVSVHIPKGWDAESLLGQFMELTKERTVTHPKHGNVTIPSGFCVQITYQREYDEEQKRERRVKDQSYTLG